MKPLTSEDLIVSTRRLVNGQNQTFHYVLKKKEVSFSQDGHISSIVAHRLVCIMLDSARRTVGGTSVDFRGDG